MDTADAEEDSLCAHTTGEVTTLNEDPEAAGESQTSHPPLTPPKINIRL